MFLILATLIIITLQSERGKEGEEECVETSLLRRTERKIEQKARNLKGKTERKPLH